MSIRNRNDVPTYAPEEVQPMRDELVSHGFKEIFTPDEVDAAINGDGATLLFINSICGCAAGNARPGAILSLQYHPIPDNLVTLFAGQEKEAVEYIRQKHLFNYISSSPFIALFKKGQLKYAMQRSDIVGTSPEEIANRLRKEYERYCTKKGN